MMILTNNTKHKTLKFTFRTIHEKISFLEIICQKLFFAKHTFLQILQPLCRKTSSCQLRKQQERPGYQAVIGCQGNEAENARRVFSYPSICLCFLLLLHMSSTKAAIRRGQRVPGPPNYGMLVEKVSFQCCELMLLYL